LIESDNVAAIVSQLPLEWHELLREQAANAPTTDEGWGRVMSIVSYCGPALSEAEWQARQDEERQRFRRGVESLRQYFADRDRDEN
jgi:hypothetical protein